ncbi:MAG: hypothetical protein DGJ47_000985 [Rickettsiaceae bacterium]
MISNVYKKIYSLKILLLTVFICFYPNISIANEQAEREIKSYIKNIKSIAVEFVQLDSAGNRSEGMLIVDKPYKFRCNYYEPFPLLISGNTNYISVYDFEMKHISRIKAKENVFNFLLLDEIDFSKQFRILSSIKNQDGYVFKIQSTQNDKISEITFDVQSKAIKQLKILEDNNIINLSFGRVFDISSPDEQLFLMPHPDRFGPPKRYTRTELKKKLGIRPL